MLDRGRSLCLGRQSGEFLAAKSRTDQTLYWLLHFVRAKIVLKLLAGGVGCKRSHPVGAQVTYGPSQNEDWRFRVFWVNVVDESKRRLLLVICLCWLLAFIRGRKPAVEVP